LFVLANICSEKKLKTQKKKNTEFKSDKRMRAFLCSFLKDQHYSSTKKIKNSDVWKGLHQVWNLFLIVARKYQIACIDTVWVISHLLRIKDAGRWKTLITFDPKKHSKKQYFELFLLVSRILQAKHYRHCIIIRISNCYCCWRHFAPLLIQEDCINVG
jgi:hypothetical protein